MVTRLFSRGADCAAAQRRLALQELQPVINLHIIYMLPKQHADNPNPKITPTWTAKPLLLSDLNMFLPHPSILMSHNDEAGFLAASKIRNDGDCGVIYLFQSVGNTHSLQ